MKRSNTKELNIVTLVIILTLTFLCIFNVVYSYFTSTDILSGNSNFGSIGANFVYTTNAGEGVVADGTTLLVTPKGDIVRGRPFNVKYEGQDISKVSIRPSEDSCNIYIRVWIDAYLVQDLVEGVPNANAVNYGKHFTFYLDGGAVTDLDVESKTTIDGKNITYFYPGAIANNTAQDIFDQLIMLNTAPLEMLGSKISVTVNFDAIQSTNGAYEIWADDNKGCSDSWT